MQVPPCLKREERSLNLEEWERRTLVKRLVEYGVRKGLGSAIQEVSRRDGGISRAIKRMRSAIEGQIASSRRSVQDRYDRELVSARKRWTSETGTLSKDLDDLESRYATFKDGKALDMDAILGEDELVSLVIEGGDPSLWQRFQGWLKRGWYRILWALGRLWRWLRGKGKRKVGVKGRPRLLLRGIGVESRFGKALFSNPTLKREVDDRIQIKDDLDGNPASYSDKDAYMAAAMEAFNQYIHEKRHEARKRSKDRGKRLKERLRRKREEERLAQEEFEQRLADLEKERASELERLEDEAMGAQREDLGRQVMEHFKRMGYIKEGPNGPAVTSRMIDRFAEFVYHSEMESLPSRLQARTGMAESKHGSYERTRMRTVHEISKMDMVESLLRSRIAHHGYHHIEDEDIIINRDISSERSHIVIMFDKSSSMEENHRLLAAKKAVLALYKAAKRANPRNMVDLATFDMKVNATDLDQLWDSKASGFTNTGEAIKVARGIIGPSRADKKMVYLITDGLPEAFTTKDGKAKAGDREKSLEFALKQASYLARVRDHRLVVLLLEPKDEIYVDAATRIVKNAAGSLIVTDPKHLASEMLVDYASAWA